MRQQHKECRYIEFIELLLKRIDSVQGVLPCDIVLVYRDPSLPASLSAGLLGGPPVLRVLGAFYSSSAQLSGELCLPVRQAGVRKKAVKKILKDLEIESVEK